MCIHRRCYLTRLKKGIRTCGAAACTNYERFPALVDLQHDSVNILHDLVNNWHDSVNNWHDSVNKFATGRRVYRTVQPERTTSGLERVNIINRTTKHAYAGTSKSFYTCKSPIGTQGPIYLTTCCYDVRGVIYRVIYSEGLYRIWYNILCNIFWRLPADM
jgi:hypothetical protein